MDGPTASAPQSKDTIQSLWRLEKIILDTLDFNEVVQKIVYSVLNELGYLNLGYRIVVLALADEKEGVLKRISLSRTEEAERALSVLPIEFGEMDIPLSAKDNLCVKVYNSQEPLTTEYWPDILCPPNTVDLALQAQSAAEIKASMVYPVVSKGKSEGIIIFSMVKPLTEVRVEEKDLLRSYADVVGLAVQNSRLYTALEDTTQQLTSANDRLHELDLLKSEFVSVASHELRTPMTAIKSYLWMALAGKGGNITDKQKYYLERAYISTDRLIKLVNDLLNVSRIESGKLNLDVQMVSLGQFTDEVISELKPRADELGIKIENLIDTNNPPPEVIADVDKIKEVMINLIGNSLKFTPKDGTISISFEQSDSLVMIHVHDTGEGIAAEDIPKLFQKFGLVSGSYVTNQKAAQGTGLGLYISKSIVELHGGKMWVESPGHGQGATFSFSLPIYSQEKLEEFQKKQQGEGLGIIHSTID